MRCQRGADLTSGADDDLADAHIHRGHTSSAGLAASGELDAALNPSGDQSLSPAAEQAWRQQLVGRALDAVDAAVEHPTIFEVDGTQR